jgi:hypothetical protein
MSNTLSTNTRKVSQRPQTRQEEVRTAAHRNKLRQIVAAFSQPALHAASKTYPVTDNQQPLAISHHRIALFTQPIKLRTHQPRALHKLKLPRDVAVDTNEMQTTLTLRYPVLVAARHPVTTLDHTLVLGAVVDESESATLDRLEVPSDQNQASGSDERLLPSQDSGNLRCEDWRGERASLADTEHLQDLCHK